jgi:hypothetical protein
MIYDTQSDIVIEDALKIDNFLHNYFFLFNIHDICMKFRKNYRTYIKWIFLFELNSFYIQNSKIELLNIFLRPKTLRFGWIYCSSYCILCVLLKSNNNLWWGVWKSDMSHAYHSLPFSFDSHLAHTTWFGGYQTVKYYFICFLPFLIICAVTFVWFWLCMDQIYNMLNTFVPIVLILCPNSILY